MALRNYTKMATLLCMLIPIWAFSVAAEAPAPAADCETLLLNMADCLSFVTNDSTAKRPEGGCCNGLKTVLKTDAECICEGFKNSAQFGVTINITRGLALPSACHVATPLVSNCGLSSIGGGGGGAPALSPLAFSPSSTAAGPTGSTGANAITPPPATRNSSSASSVLAFPAGWLALSFLAAASLTLF